MDLDVKMKAVVLAATFLIVSQFLYEMIIFLSLGLYVFREQPKQSQLMELRYIS